jgi:SAM-dependent methyltransferase
MSMATVIIDRIPELRTASVYELSARGPLHAFLLRKCGSLVSSQYIEGAPSGSEVAGVRVEDVQRLTFPDHSFDVCTSTEVFEHVPDDRQAFAEMLRVLKPLGLLIFTVPISLTMNTRERAAIVNGTVTHFVAPEFHRDPACRDAPVLSFRDYGIDIVARLNEAGFSQAEVVNLNSTSWFGYRRPVILAQKRLSHVA